MEGCLYFPGGEKNGYFKIQKQSGMIFLTESDKLLCSFDCPSQSDSRKANFFTTKSKN